MTAIEQALEHMRSPQGLAEMVGRLTDAGQLEAVEEGLQAPAEGPVTLAAVVAAVRRIRYHRGQVAQVQQQAAELRAPLLAALAEINQWEAGELAEREARIRHHESVCAAYYRANPPERDRKSLKIPGGKIKCKAGGPKIRWPEGKENEDRLLTQVQAHRPDLVRQEPKLDKNDLKKVAQIHQGRVLLPVSNEPDCELIELQGVVVATEPDTWSVDLDDNG